ncbi:MAG TPA: hypothetical protein DCQ93_10360 [Bacteroidetes bacterium]|nr:hypothetical protein [Bacteroidota bacterium]
MRKIYTQSILFSKLISSCVTVLSVMMILFLNSRNSIAQCSTGDWLGTTSVDWNVASNWCGGIIPTSSTDVTIPGSATNQPVISANATCHDLTIADALASLVLSSNNFTVTGNIVNNGGYIQTGGTLILNGSSAQSIPSLFCTNVKIDNAAGVVISGDLTVNGVLNLFNGLISTGGNKIIIINPTAGAVTGFSNSSYVNGKMVRYINNGTFDFPIGTATKYELATLTFNNLSPTIFITGEFFSSNTGCSVVPNILNGNGGSYGPYVNGTALTNLLDGGYWKLTPDNQPTSGDYDVTLNERGYSVSPPGPTYCAVIKRDDCSLDWHSYGVHSNATQSISGGTVTAKRSTLTSFSDFGIGFSGATLPITLTSFTAQKINHDLDALLEWKTSSEENNHYFEIEVSTGAITDGNILFEKIGEVTGNGTTEVEHHYSFIHKSPAKSGFRYYRLKQVDLDGSYSYSNIVALSFSPEILLTNVYPNPTDNVIYFDLNISGEKQITFSVTDLLGREMILNSSFVHAGVQTMNADVSNLAQGIYFLNISDGGNTIIHRKFEKF